MSSYGVEAGVLSMKTRLRAMGSHPASGRKTWTARALLLATVLLASSQAQTHDLHADADPANDWIEGLANGENVSCCGSNDCYPLAASALQFTRSGDLAVEIGGSWFRVLERRLLRDSSPDGRAWVCPQSESTGGGYMYSVQGVRCLMLPMVM